MPGTWVDTCSPSTAANFTAGVEQKKFLPFDSPRRFCWGACPPRKRAASCGFVTRFCGSAAGHLTPRKPLATRAIHSIKYKQAPWLAIAKLFLFVFYNPTPNFVCPEDGNFHRENCFGGLEAVNCPEFPRVASVDFFVVFIFILVKNSQSVNTQNLKYCQWDGVFNFILAFENILCLVCYERA